MKVAIVHELLTMRGGAERLTKVVADMFPEAPVYTLLYNEKKLGDWFPRERVRTSRLQKFAKFSTNHHLYLRRFSKAVEAWNFDEYDLVISFSSAFAHGIKTNGKTKHLCYVNSPARYLWDRTFDVQNRAGWLQKKYLERTFHKLREWDSEAGERPDKILAASKEIKRRVELYWRRESEVLYPCIDDCWLDQSHVETCESASPNQTTNKTYYALASTLVPYKRIELAIEACNKLGKTLKIAGEGPHKKSLMKIAGPTIEFLGYIDQKNLVSLLQRARAFIFPGYEDFGIAPIEAMSCGTPVIAFGKGGALETVRAGETGKFFDEPSAESLASTITDFESKNYDADACRKQAERFSREKFEAGIRHIIKNM
jgi:glycosyltransferase involved in cell wall biosynthesis